MKRDIHRESRFLPTHLHSTPRLGGPSRNIAMALGMEKTRIMWLPDDEKNLKIRSLVLTEFTNVTDRQTDGRTD